MTRRLNLNLYLSKRDFEADLNLIWANCRKYNTDPGSVFVMVRFCWSCGVLSERNICKHANEMEKRQRKIMKRVPDTDISPYKDMVLSENMASPAVPRVASLNASLDSAVQSTSPPLPAIKVSVPIPAALQHMQGGLISVAAEPPTGILYTTALAEPHKVRCKQRIVVRLTVPSAAPQGPFGAL